MGDREEKLKAHDAAASEISEALTDVNIRHLFIGGYAASFLGGDRVTEDVDVLVEKNCVAYLKKRKGFDSTSDGRLSFNYKGTIVYIDIMRGPVPFASPPWTLPAPSEVASWVIQPKQHPERALKRSISIVHPDTLILMKMITWHAADIATRREKKTRQETDFQDIRHILDWLDDNDEMVRFPKIVDRDYRRTCIKTIGKLFKDYPDLRAIIANTVTPAQLSTALYYNGLEGKLEDD